MLDPKELRHQSRLLAGLPPLKLRPPFLQERLHRLFVVLGAAGLLLGYMGNIQALPKICLQLIKDEILDRIAERQIT